MATGMLFIGWGEVVRGREQKAIQVFNEAVQFWQQLQQGGQIEGFDAALLEPHGGDLQGFFLLRGDRERLTSLRRQPDFERIIQRAQLVVDGMGVVEAVTGEVLGDLLSGYQAAAQELA